MISSIKKLNLVTFTAIGETNLLSGKENQTSIHKIFYTKVIKKLLNDLNFFLVIVCLIFVNIRLKPETLLNKKFATSLKLAKSKLFLQRREV